jgi:hypothetical protein
MPIDGRSKRKAGTVHRGWEALYAEANLVFPDIVRRYEEVARFHQWLIENRQAQLQSEIASAQRRIEERHAERERVEVRRRQITAALRTDGPAEELLRLRDELSEKEVVVRALEARLNEAPRLEKQAEETQQEVEDATRALRQDRRERSAVANQASRAIRGRSDAGVQVVVFWGVAMSAGRSDLPMVLEHGAPGTAPTLRSSLVVPAMIAEAGHRAAKRFLDFFAASIENDNTRLAYYRAACSFFAWLEEHGIGELTDIEPFHVAAYLKALKVSNASDRAAKECTASRPTVKQHLAAIRMLFDWLVVGQVLAINPAHAVRGPKHVVKRGKTPVLSEEQARRLLASIKITKAIEAEDGSKKEVPWLVGLRDRALIGVMVYSFEQLRAHQRRRHDGGRGLLFERQALVAAAARERWQAP